MKQTVLSHRCPRCTRALRKSENPEYVFECPDCDEDFYEFEADKVTVHFSDPTPEDIQPFIDQGFNIDFSQYVKLTVMPERAVLSSFCFMERKTVDRLGVRYIADHVMLHATESGGVAVTVSENDWRNDPARAPEKRISVQFVETERGTGREVYRSQETGRYYLRESHYPREQFAKWLVCGTRRCFDDGDEPRPNLIFVCNGEEEKVFYDDWNGVAAYSATFNENFGKERED